VLARFIARVRSHALIAPLLEVEATKFGLKK